MKQTHVARYLILVIALILAVQLPAPAHASESFSAPSGVAIDRHGNVYVADTGNGRVIELSPLGRTIRSWDANGIDFELGSPTGIAVDSAGNVYATDPANNSVQKYAPGGRLIGQWGTTGDGEFNSPQSVTVGGRGNVFVANTGNNNIEKLSAGGYVLATWEVWGQKGDGPLTPQAVAVDRNGNVYSTVHRLAANCFCPTPNNSSSFSIQKRDANGALLAEWTGFTNLGGIAIGGRGNVFVTVSDRGQVIKLSPTGERLATYGNQQAGPVLFTNPTGLALDTRGNIYIADTPNDRILKLSSTGRVIAVWGDIVGSI